jgi:hypothetical protein
MNLGAVLARFPVLIFSDQRQWIVPGALAQLVDRMKDEKVGAVSARLCEWDLNGRSSGLRRLENWVKRQEARHGDLIGVHGPLFAIRKELYVAIPLNIILDDLYLTLQVLKSRSVVMLDECGIVDAPLGRLYDLERVKRYLRGYAQLCSRSGLAGLPPRVLTMLVWHKFYRAVLPGLVTACVLGALAFLVDRSSAPAIGWTFCLAIGMIILLCYKADHSPDPGLACRLWFLYTIAPFLLLFEHLSRKFGARVE